MQFMTIIIQTSFKQVYFINHRKFREQRAYSTYSRPFNPKFEIFYVPTDTEYSSFFHPVDEIII